MANKPRTITAPFAGIRSTTTNDDASPFGVPAQRGLTDWRQLIPAYEACIEGIRDDWSNYLANCGIDDLLGRARFLNDRQMGVYVHRYSADRVVVATEPTLSPTPAGGRPRNHILWPFRNDHTTAAGCKPRWRPYRCRVGGHAARSRRRRTRHLANA